MVAKPLKTKSKLPESRHPLFAPMVALWFAALFGLGSLAIRPALLEAAVLALRLDLVVPAAAPPLGFTFRILLALTLFVIGGAIGFVLARTMTRDKTPPTRIDAKASVHLSEGPTITRIDLEVEASVPGMDDATFQKYAAEAKAGCPVSKALAAVPEIALTAKLTN